ncbi:MAG TPA: AAA family ATPase [Candidatus Ozemobacteraceae bacterium]|nr:AAA family ATPase [Candidatus Ozemobacteraceae bacterium]HQG27364.1 AAA family ATPase [Candidatus Ozemobacteraceae bacterium]
MPRTAGITALKRALMAGTPVIAISSWEEEQVIATLAAISRSVFQSDKTLTQWDLQAGLTAGDLNQPGVTTPEAALEAAVRATEPGFFVFRDIIPFLEKPEIQRRLRTVNTAFRGQNRFLFLLGGDIHLPVDVRKDVYLLDFGLPDQAELTDLIERAFASATKRGAENKMTPENLAAAATALQGFTTTEAQQCLTKLLWGVKVIDGSIVKQLQEEKEQLARKEGILEYVRTDSSLEDVGGLENLKNWLTKRRRLFSPEAAAAGLRPPRGLLMMGISGCGKSLSVKAISSLWNLPLFRLDMNQVYSGLHGSPEGAFHRAIKSIEAMAPAILWFDEIEGGISSSTMKDGSTGSHIFSAFLTWMQEKKADVFVAATANRIDLLPAEIIRKGRFDQVFFIDLPNDREREEIFKVHLQRRGVDTATFDLTLLSVSTEFWNGAEIEHVVEAAMVEAFDRGAQLTLDDLYTIIRGTVPLSRTMAEQIKFIRAWASERAISASKSDK